MPTAAKDMTTQSAAGASEGAPAVLADEAAEARRLFENKLVRVSLRMPRSATQVAEVEFDMSMQELMANVLMTGDALAEVLKVQDGSYENEATPRQLTTRLRRALASAEKIKRGRFTDFDEMFDALAEATRR